MFEMWDHLVFGIGAFFGNPAYVTFSVLSFSLALLIIYKLRDTTLGFRSRLILIYSHLTLISFPAMLLASSLSCASLGAECPVTIARAGLLLFPISILASLLVGWLLLPRFFRIGAFKSEEYSDFIKHESSLLGMAVPSLYVFNSQKAAAYSVGGFKPAIFVSVGMLELLTRKEIEAVLLHELGHLSLGSPHVKISLAIMNLFSPLARMMPSSYPVSEERRADAFAAKRQSTRKYLEGARKKSEEFD